MATTLTAMSSSKSALLRKKHRRNSVLIVAGVLIICVAASWIILLLRTTRIPSSSETTVTGRRSSLGRMAAHRKSGESDRRPGLDITSPLSRPRIVVADASTGATSSTERVVEKATITSLRVKVVEESKMEANSAAADPLPSFNNSASIQYDIRVSLNCDDSSKINRNSAKALFCEAATLQKYNADDPDATKAKHSHIQQVWALARAIMTKDIIHTVLSCAVKQNATLLQEHQVQLWAPKGDIGIKTVLKELNSGNKVAEYGFESLPPGSLGPGKLYVDAGSNLGLVSLLVSLRYPGTDVISIEAAAPTWLLQQLNLRLNLPFDGYFDRHVAIVQAGLGATDGEVFPMMWRPSSTTSTRGWTPKAEHNQNDDIELQVKLRSLRSILVEFNHPPNADIAFLKIDCEGCEYNAIPSMTAEEFDAIQMGVGELHWGYIPDAKKPSSERARQTHERLCRFHNFASQAKECCAFPDLRVIDDHQQQHDGRISNAMHSSNRPVVKDVAGAMCLDFDEWAVRKRLRDIPDDKGWLNMDSSMA